MQMWLLSAASALGDSDFCYLDPHVRIADTSGYTRPHVHPNLKEDGMCYFSSQFWSINEILVFQSYFLGWLGYVSSVIVIFYLPKFPL